MIIGAYYELPTGEIAYIYSGSGRGNKTKYLYYFDDGTKEAKSVLQEGTSDWKYRDGLRDFPNASNPRLPYVFDLNWDLKYMSDLRRELQGHEDEEEIRAQMRGQGIKVGGIDTEPEKGEEEGFPKSGHLFHGDCNGCTQRLDTCPKCRFFTSNWGLPDYNPSHGKMPISFWGRVVRSWESACKEFKG